MAFSRVEKPLNPVPIGKLDWSNIIILAVFINPIMCYDLKNENTEKFL